MKGHNCGIEDCTCPTNGKCKCPSNYDHHKDNSPEYNRFLEQMGHDMSNYKQTNV